MKRLSIINESDGFVVFHIVIIVSYCYKIVSSTKVFFAPTCNTRVEGTGSTLFFLLQSSSSFHSRYSFETIPTVYRSIKWICYRSSIDQLGTAKLFGRSYRFPLSFDEFV